MDTSKSSPVDWIGKNYLSFTTNAVFSEENAQTIVDWLYGLSECTPKGLFTMKPESLHITVLDWIAPFSEYGGADKQALFDGMKSSIHSTLDKIASEMKPFDVHFTEIRVTPGTIIIVGRDAGEYQSVRSQCTQQVKIPEGGKDPPNIIHSSLARFIEPSIDLKPVQSYIESHPLDITQRISAFRLVKAREGTMQDFSVLETFSLVG